MADNDEYIPIEIFRASIAAARRARENPVEHRNHRNSAEAAAVVETTTATRRKRRRWWNFATTTAATRWKLRKMCKHKLRGLLFDRAVRRKQSIHREIHMWRQPRPNNLVDRQNYQTHQRNLKSTNKHFKVPLINEINNLLFLRPLFLSDNTIAHLKLHLLRRKRPRHCRRMDHYVFHR